MTLLLYPGLCGPLLRAEDIAQHEHLLHASTSSSWAGSSGFDEDGVLWDRTRVSPAAPHIGDLEMRVGQAEQSQAQARAAAEEARMASECALQCDAQLQMEQEKTSQQVTQMLVLQATETQKQI